MDDVKSPAFRTAVGGFNKKDVTDYITKLCLTYDEASAKLEDKIKELTDELAELRGQLDAANSKTGTQSFSAISEKAAANNGEIDRANNIIAEQNQKIETLKEENDALKAKLCDFSALEAKASQYESMTSRMGEIFMEATADAERIRNEAKFSSEALLTKTEVECHNKRVAAEAEIKKLTKERHAELNRIFDETQLEINRILVSFSDRSSAIVGDTEGEHLDGSAAANTTEDNR